jgi:O-acetylhomoserine (thiol)-lyase
MLDDSKLTFDTRCLHSGQKPEAHGSARAVPIYQTTSYVFENTAHAAALFNLEEFGNIYSRMSNPTVTVFEDRMASLEGGAAAIATASGQAAQLVAVASLCEAGDEFVAATTLYGGTFTQFDATLRRFGITPRFVEPDDPENFRKAITPKTRFLYGETIANPRMNVLDISAVAEIANEARIPLIVDNTFASPFLCRPIAHGAHIVVQSATKFIGGHGTSLGGVIVDSGKFPWREADSPQMNGPSRGYHGMRFSEKFGNLAFLTKCRIEGLRDLGPCMSPFNAFLLLQGLETLPLRMRKHSENTLALAEYLEKHPLVNWVKYPGLQSSPYFHLAQKYLPDGAGAVLTFGIKGGLEAASAFIDNVQVFSHLANIGDAKSLVLHPASTTHQQLPPDDLAMAGITDDMIRVSVGLEGIEDLIRDVEQALEISKNPRAARQRRRDYMKQKVREVLDGEYRRWADLRPHKVSS